MAVTLILNSVHGIPFPLPTDRKKLVNAIRYLTARDYALAIALRDASGKITDDTIETGKIGKEVLASIYYLTEDNEHALHVLTQDYEYDWCNCLAGGYPVHRDLILHTMYIEHNRMVSEYFTPPKVREDSKRKYDELVKKYSNLDARPEVLIDHPSAKQEDGVFSPLELDGYVKSIPPELKAECGVTVAVPNKDIIIYNGTKMLPSELDSLLFLGEKGDDMLSGWTETDYSGSKEFVAIQMERDNEKVVTWNEGTLSRREEIDWRKADLSVVTFIREHRNQIEHFYEEKRKNDSQWSMSETISEVLGMK